MPDTLATQVQASAEAHTHTVPAKSVHVLTGDSILHPAAADSARVFRAEEYPAPDTAYIAQWAEEHAAEIAAAKAKMPPPPPAWTKGIEPEPRPAEGAGGNGFTAAIVVLILLVGMSLRSAGNLMPMMFRDLFSIRSRSRNFDEHTARETRLIIIFIMQTVIYMGIMLCAFGCRWNGMTMRPAMIAPMWLCVAAAAVYYVFALCAYSAVGYAFTTPEKSRQWVRGFNASMVITGFMLLIPALVTVFYPDAGNITIPVAATVYLLARLMFIIKGFRIFYDKFSSLVYFILYLCTLEIIPFIFIIAFAVEILK